MKKNEIKQMHLVLLSECLDTKLLEFGFVRKNNSTRFTRSIAIGNQDIDVIVELPRYGDDSSISHIKPLILLRYPEINKTALEIVGGDESLLGGPKDITLSIPFGFAGPERHLKDWRPRDENDYLKKFEELYEFILSNVLPFFREYDSADALVRGYESGDERLMKGLPFALRVIASAVLCSQHDKARSIAKKVFASSIGLSNRYNAVLNFFKISF
jgi:hypothetical protein